MTAKTTLVQTRLRLLAGAAVLCASAPALMPLSAHASEGRYLNWQNKAPVQAPVQAAPVQNTVEFQGHSMPVPPSAYGQVGDPYARVLSWGTKNRPPENAPAPQPVASAPPPRAPINRAPVQATAPASEPAPAPRRASNYRDTWPQYAPQPMASTLPEPVQPQPIYDDPAPQRPAPPMVTAEMPQAPVPVPAPVPAPPPAPVPAPAPRPAPPPAPLAATDGAYQVPATSKYASRIASARAAQTQPAPASQSAPPAAAAPAKPEKLAQSEKPTKAAPVKPAKDAKPALADMPAPVTETASDDKPFVPGQHYTDASEAPRLYSLHRDYGLRPDPITVDANATGAMLDTSKLDAAEAKAEKAESEAAGDAEPDDAAEAAKDTAQTAPNRKNSPSTKADAKVAGAAAKVTPTP